MQIYRAAQTGYDICVGAFGIVYHTEYEKSSYKRREDGIAAGFINMKKKIYEKNVKVIQTLI